MSPSPVSQYLTEQNIDHREFTHPGAVRSFEQAAAERGQEPGQVVRSLLFRLSEDNFVMVLVAGPQQIPWKPLRRYLGERRVTMADDDELLAVTGYRKGTVSPFGLPGPVRILIDQTVLQYEEISIGSGERNTTVIMASAVLQAALSDAELVDLLP